MSSSNSFYTMNGVLQRHLYVQRPRRLNNPIGVTGQRTPTFPEMYSFTRKPRFTPKLPKIDTGIPRIGRNFPYG